MTPGALAPLSTADEDRIIRQALGWRDDLEVSAALLPDSTERGIVRGDLDGAPRDSLTPDELKLRALGQGARRGRR